MNNCAGGTTPWGTVLSGEENFNQYFRATGTDVKETRYGLSATQDARNWRSIDPRWDATTADYAHEPNRFGWVVEVDPSDPTSTPVKHTAMGRFKHEGANVIVNRDGHVVAYMGDDERFDYLYRFVSRDRMQPGKSSRARRHNLTLLSEGDLSVARYAGDGLDDGVSDGTGEWIPLTRGGRSMVPGFSVEEVLVYTRLAADAVQPTTRPTRSPGTCSSSAVTPRPPAPTSAAGPARSPRSRAPTTSPSTARATSGCRPTDSRARSR